MTDSLETRLEGWMQETGGFDAADASGFVLGLELPRRRQGVRLGGFMVPAIGVAVALVVVVGAGLGLMWGLGVPGGGPAHGVASVSPGPTESLGASGTPAPCPAALIEGDLVVSDTWGLALRDLGGTTRQVIWPDDYSVSQRPPRVALLDPSGAAVAWAGDHVQIGGGETGDGAVVACGGITVVAGPSPAEAPTARPSSAGPVVVCGRISPTACAKAIALARMTAPLIVVDDVCAPTVSCDRKYPFDSLVVFVTAGGDTTGWYAFEVTGLKDDAPTDAKPWLGSGWPQHIVDLVTANLP
jgi:hypothetical protein